MTTETVLTDESIAEALVKNDIFLYEWEVTRYDINFARAIEQAVLQSPEVQAWKRDADRLSWILGQPNCVVVEGIGGFWLCWIDEEDPNQTEYQQGSYPSARAAIEAAMEQQT